MATRRMRATTSKSSGVTPNEVESELTCYCGLRSPLLIAKTKKNVGIRFYGCAKFDDPSCCNFFMWVDQKIPDQARDMIVELLERNQALSESSQSRCNDDYVSSLIAKMKAQKAKNGLLKEELARVKKGKMLYQLGFFLCMCYIIMGIIFNVKASEKFLSLP